MAAPPESPGHRLIVDPIACDGIGICSRLAASAITLDRWGFPLVEAGALSRQQVRAAERAVRGCPRGALMITPVPAPAPAPADDRHPPA